MDADRAEDDAAAAASLPDDVVARLDARLALAQRGSRLPSVVAAVAGRDGAGWTGTAGLVDGSPPTADTQYRIGSITKTVVAVAVLRLVDAGRVGLDDRVVDHLPGEDLAAHAVGRASVAQLLQHAAGTPAETTGPWWERTPGGDLAALLADVAVRPPAGPAGRRHHYSNVGFGLLGGVLAHHHGRPWADVVHDELLVPLGMRRTTTAPVAPAAPGLAVHPWSDAVLPEPAHDAGAMGPAGQLWSSLADLVTWGRFLGGDLEGADGPLLTRATWEAMCVPSVVAHVPGQRWTTAHGLGVQVFNTDGRVRVGHGGSMPGFLAGVRTDPATGVVLALATNTTAGLDPDLGADLLALAEPWLAEDGPWTPAPAPAGVGELLGVWYWGPRPHVVEATSDGLRLRTLDDRGRASRFVPDGDGWRGTDAYYAGEPLRVVRDAAGSAVALDLASFVLTRTPYDPDPAAGVPGGVAPWG